MPYTDVKHKETVPHEQCAFSPGRKTQFYAISLTLVIFHTAAILIIAEILQQLPSLSEKQVLFCRRQYSTVPTHKTCKLSRNWVITHDHMSVLCYYISFIYHFFRHLHFRDCKPTEMADEKIRTLADLKRDTNTY